MLSILLVAEFTLGFYRWDEWGHDPSHWGWGVAIGPLRIVWDQSHAPLSDAEVRLRLLGY